MKHLGLGLISIVLWIPLTINAVITSPHSLNHLNKEAKQAYYAYDYSTALEKWEQALNLARQTKNHQAMSIFLGNLGKVYKKLGQYQQALKLYQQALEIDQDNSDKYAQSINLTNLGLVHKYLGQYQQALTHFQQALAIKRELNDKKGEAASLANVGIVYRNLGQYQEALMYYQEALLIHRNIDDKRGIGNDLSNIGIVHRNLGQYQQALDHYQQALAIHRNIGNKQTESRILSVMGNVYSNLGQYQQASELYQQSLTIRREIGEHGESTDLTNLGVVQLHLGQYQVALEYFQQALDIHRGIGDKRSEGIDLTNIGVVYDNLGQYEIALAYYQQALTIHRDIGDQSGEAANLTNLGFTYKNLVEAKIFGQKFQYSKALNFYQQALVIERNIGDKRGMGNNLTNLGFIYQQLGNYLKALELHQKAVTIQHNIGDKRGEGDSLTHLGWTYKNLNQYQQAKKAFQDSIFILEPLGTDILWEAQRGLAQVEIQFNQLDTAIIHYEKTLDNIENLRADLVKQSHKLSFMRNKLAVYDEFIALLQNLHEKQPTKGYDRKSLEIFERKQGRVFLEQIGQSGAKRFSGVPENITKQEQSLLKQQAKTQINLVQERNKPFVEQNRYLIKELTQRLNTLKTSLLVLKNQIKEKYPDYYALKYPQPVTVKTLQNKVLKPNERILVYEVMPDKTALWIIGQSQFTLFTLPVGEETLKESIYDKEYGLRPLIINKWPELTEESHLLYQKLLPDVAHKLLRDVNTLYIVPTGPLYGLPFETLVTHTTTDDKPHYLIQDYAIVYLSSASLLTILRDTQAQRKNKPNQQFIAFADPAYQPCSNNDTLGINKKNGLRTPTIAQLRTQTYLDTINDTCFPPLPETADEARAIAALFKAPFDALKLGKNATLNTVFKLNKKGKLDDYRYLLFSVHGILPGEIKEIAQPTLVLSNSQTEGYLTMADAFSLQLNADFINLSACNTGRGENIRGEGIMGLTRAFMYAGTPAITVTLWSVESYSAQELSVNLFKNLKMGKKPAEALRQIKLKMINGKASKSYYNHPLYWASFVVYGDGG
ncbi:tetratricopeptide repeat protein [Candidatus Parabeggiatoa sp. HSG14]|uniref:CHAT domain-containing tetratricopeptide repeat protein n=1 Tax=Candidatus Parabeggiatoa sp. HSG14 TaxID=3055593 RepID=UPI0025A7F593|nr:tetratricopeptide repeat protein [Thiotrichales bacterium HSG14]